MVFYGGKPTTGHSFISHGCLLFSTCQEGCIGTKIDRWNPCPRMDQFSHGTLSFSFSARTLPCRTSRNESLPWQTMWYRAQMLCDGWTHNRATLGKQGPRCRCLYFFWVPWWRLCPLLLDTLFVFLNSQLSLPTVFRRASLFCLHRRGWTSSCFLPRGSCSIYLSLCGSTLTCAFSASVGLTSSLCSESAVPALP